MRGLFFANRQLDVRHATMSGPGASCLNHRNHAGISSLLLRSASLARRPFLLSKRPRKIHLNPRLARRLRSAAVRLSVRKFRQTPSPKRKNSCNSNCGPMSGRRPPKAGAGRWHRSTNFASARAKSRSSRPLRPIRNGIRFSPATRLDPRARHFFAPTPIPARSPIKKTTSPSPHLPNSPAGSNNGS